MAPETHAIVDWDCEDWQSYPDKRARAEIVLRREIPRQFPGATKGIVTQVGHTGWKRGRGGRSDARLHYDVDVEQPGQELRNRHIAVTYNDHYWITEGRERTTAGPSSSSTTSQVPAQTVTQRAIAPMRGRLSGRGGSSLPQQPSGGHSGLSLGRGQPGSSQPQQPSGGHSILGFGHGQPGPSQPEHPSAGFSILGHGGAQPGPSPPQHQSAGHSILGRGAAQPGASQPQQPRAHFSILGRGRGQQPQPQPSQPGFSIRGGAGNQQPRGGRSIRGAAAGRGGGTEQHTESAGEESE